MLRGAEAVLIFADMFRLLPNLCLTWKMKFKCPAFVSYFGHIGYQILNSVSQ